jgi:predicted nuclease of predicted toxin-antitoxin system
MKLLIDECLHTSLTGVAHDAGYACDHVNFLGLSGYKDWQLIDRIRESEYTFVTNNRVDFAALYGREEIHPGLIIIVPNVVPRLQPPAHGHKKGSLSGTRRRTEHSLTLPLASRLRHLRLWGWRVAQADIYPTVEEHCVEEDMHLRSDEVGELKRACALVSEAEQIFYSLRLGATASGTMELGAALSLAKERLRVPGKEDSQRDAHGAGPLTVGETGLTGVKDAAGSGASRERHRS